MRAMTTTAESTGSRPRPMTSPIHPAVRVGHVHLRVSDLERSLAFYRDALGFAVFADGRPHGLDAVFLAAGDYHHHVALNSWESAGATPPPPGHTGLFHVAFLYPDRLALVTAVHRLMAYGQCVEHYTDHVGTVSVYVEDPDANGVELYYDRPPIAWRDDAGHPVLGAHRFPIDALLEPEAVPPAPGT